jgi:5-methylcytosine-specific restriction endonuclease McrA
MNARDLSNRLAELLKKERHALAEFLIALSVFDGERRWVELGHSSLFSYLHRDLGLSKGAAFYRMTAAQLIQRHPEIVEPLRDGRLCLTTVVALSKVLTAENVLEVLPRFFQLSKREAQEVKAELCPEEAAPMRTVVTAVRSAASATPTVHLANRLLDLGQVEVHLANQPAAQPVPASSAETMPPKPAEPVMTIEPKTADLSRVHITVSRELLRKLDAARDALSHSHPGASEAEVLEAGLDLLLERHARRKGIVKRPRKEPSTPRRARSEGTDRYIPAHVRREVWKRDHGRCQFPLEGGGICGSTYQVELDHIIPVAKGGESTVDNVRCACKAHNLHAARQAFGDAWMDRYTGERLRRAASSRRRHE